ncbi:MAG: POTRA domain-containing protein [Terriglobales bacterium]
MKKTVILLLVSLLHPVAAESQKPAGSKTSVVTAYKLVGLKVTGTQRYSEREILPASGLQLGQNVGEADFKEAARRLGDTGLFTDVAYSFSYSSAGTKLELQLTDTDQGKLVPAHFENFVWFTDAELLTELQRRVPLFKQVLPVAGALPDRIEEGLQAILDEKQIPARVDYLREGRQDGGDLIGIAYRVTEIAIRVRNLEFPGASPEHVPLLTTAARRVSGAEYARSSLAAVAHFDLLPVYLQRGYLKASFAAADARVVTQSGGEVEVDAILPVTPGRVYSTSGVEWKGNSVLKVEDLQNLIHLPIGQPADAMRLVSDLENVTKLYHTRGYMVARITPLPLMDDDKSTVHYDLTVVEGDQFKMGELEILGLDSQARAHLQAAWKLREGEPYNGEYPKKFLDETSRLLPAGVPWGITVHEAVNEKDKTVDVTLRFTAR